MASDGWILYLQTGILKNKDCLDFILLQLYNVWNILINNMKMRINGVLVASSSVITHLCIASESVITLVIRIMLL